MLTDLLITNFALIEKLHVSFTSGFNVLTGETGAGKSIVLDAVDLLLGGRARSEVIRSGAEEATVEAVFQLPEGHQLRSQLDQAGLLAGDELVVRRILARTGKNRVFVNGSPVPLSQLRNLTGALVNIYGQHEHQSLQQPEHHLGMLDQAAGLQERVADYRISYQQFCALRDELDGLDEAERQRHQRQDLLCYQRQELASAQLSPSEDEELERERLLMQHAEKLVTASQGGYETLYAGQQAVCERLATIAAELEGLQHIDQQLADPAERLRHHQYSLEDIAQDLRSYAERLEFDPQRQEQLEERAALLASLKRKYAPTVAELLSYLEEVEQELATLDQSENRRQQLQQALTDQYQKVQSAGAMLSAERQRAARELAGRVEMELAGLAMPGAAFKVVLEPLSEPGTKGLERGEFYLSANPGEAPQPLARIASGGELSRIMLALRLSVPDSDSVSSLVFDEVDAGIGGEAATAVGRKIKQLGRGLQVLCVTHLPQVAAFADYHFQVSKAERGGRTTTTLTPLDSTEGRVAEMARMLGGGQVGPQALEHARELLQQGEVPPGECS